MLEVAENYLALGNARAAKRQASAVRALIPRGTANDVRAGRIVRRLESLERKLAPAPSSPDTGPLQLGPSTSVHTVPGGLPTLGRRR